jgi:glycosyltransferase involved in cell wall biosynthesis
VAYADGDALDEISTKICCKLATKADTNAIIAAMHIILNAMFWNQPTVGSGQYLHGLLGALPSLAPQHQYTLLVPSYLGEVPNVPAPFTLVRLSTPFDGRSENLAKLWFEQISVPQAAAKLKGDLLHVPYFAAPFSSRVPVVVSILDIIPLLLPEYQGSRAVRAYMKLVSAASRRAKWALTLSEHSRRDIVQHLGIPAERVTATHLAALPHFAPRDREQARAEVAERYGISKPFVYYVGGLDARKNVPTLIRAFARMRRAGGPDVQLVIAGKAFSDDRTMFPDLDAIIADEALGDAVQRITVPYNDGPLLMNAALAYAFPSRYEGFGLPPLEAMACGTPTLVSNSSSLGEVVGDAAIQLPPDDLDAWADALRRICEDATLREQLSVKGLARASEFSYDRVAQSILSIYQQIGSKP